MGKGEEEVLICVKLILIINHTYTFIYQYYVMKCFARLIFIIMYLYDY